MFDVAGNIVLNNDIAFGTKHELPVIGRLERYFGETITKVQERYSPYDAYSDNTKYEIKSRRNKFAAYPTTIVAVDKTTRTAGSRLVFVFHFTDGLYYIVYDAAKFASYEVKDVAAYRTGGVRTEKPHFFIPVVDLTRIDI